MGSRTEALLALEDGSPFSGTPAVSSMQEIHMEAGS